MKTSENCLNRILNGTASKKNAIVVVGIFSVLKRAFAEIL